MYRLYNYTAERNTTALTRKLITSKFDVLTSSLHWYDCRCNIADVIKVVMEAHSSIRKDEEMRKEMQACASLVLPSIRTKLKAPCSHCQRRHWTKYKNKWIKSVTWGQSNQKNKSPTFCVLSIARPLSLDDKDSPLGIPYRSPGELRRQHRYAFSDSWQFYQFMKENVPTFYVTYKMY